MTMDSVDWAAASVLSGFAVLSGSKAHTCAPGGCNLLNFSRRKLQTSSAFKHSRWRPRACSYSNRTSSGSFTNFIPSLTKRSCKSSGSSLLKNVGVGPCTQEILPPSWTGKTAWCMAAFHVAKPKIVWRRSPRTGKSAKKRSNGKRPSDTSFAQYVMRPRMLQATGPSNNNLFHCLSKDGSCSSISGKGKAFREDNRAKLPCTNAQLPVLKGVGGPQQIRPPRPSSSCGWTRTAAAP
mmetsp:Transcript_29755/g.98631  ORF Transcript_29755/g.98631 Transcript_29755/m.98631 type:complete len:237 (-) Transcript_29755:4249-4959(-)